MPQTGRPEMKARVPSIGSSTQTNSRVGALGAVLLADDAVVRIGRRDQLAHRRLGVAVGHRSPDRSRPLPLFSTASVPGNAA